MLKYLQHSVTDLTKIALTCLIIYSQLVFCQASIAETANVAGNLVPSMNFKNGNSQNTINIQILDKITGRTKNLSANMYKTVNLSSHIEITPYYCWRSKPTEAEENIALLEINEQGNNIFFGWLFSSSSSLNSLEHPIYDVILKECL